MRITCKHCGRYIGEAKGTTIIEGLICPNSKCKARLNIKIVTPRSTEAEINYKFANPEANPRNGALNTGTISADPQGAQGAGDHKQ